MITTEQNKLITGEAKRKPYYDPVTKETYLRVRTANYDLKMITGSFSIEPDPADRLYSFTVNRNEFGELVKKERFMSHNVCLGAEKCFFCGKDMKHHEPMIDNPGFSPLVVMVIVSIAAIVFLLNI